MRPQWRRAFLVPGIFLQILLWSVPRLMWIERIDPKEKLLRRLGQPFDGSPENFLTSIGTLPPIPIGIASIARQAFGRHVEFFRRTGQFDHRGVFRQEIIVLLSSHMLHMIKAATKVVLGLHHLNVVAHQSRREPVPLEDLRHHRIMIRQGVPANAWEGATAGKNLDAINYSRE